MGIAVQSLLNNALDDDTLDEGYVSNVAPWLLSELIRDIDPRNLNLHRIYVRKKGSVPIW